MSIFRHISKQLSNNIDVRHLMPHQEKLALLSLIVFAVVFFSPFFFSGMIPFPADDLLGMYHPWRDGIWDGYAAGVPYKNPLITDPVRQQYVWRYLSVDQMKRGDLPLWNPYAFLGTPLLANVQSAPFYPGNILFFLFPFSMAWGLLVVVQPLLASIFLYAYLRYFHFSRVASLVGGLSFAYGGFSISWLEWNTIGHTMLWLPLILLSKEHLIRRVTIPWAVVLLFAECSSLLAGHLQIFFYVTGISTMYLMVRVGMQSYHKKKIEWLKNLVRHVWVFIVIGLLMISVTSSFWVPALRFIVVSSRSVDQGMWGGDGWFLPYKHIVQFISPDFFGNPSTNNYWGTWNYGEMVGYIGVLPLYFCLFAVWKRRDRFTLFYACIAFVSLLFALPTIFGKVPFLLHIPFVSSSQPTRLLSLVTFSCSVLAAVGVHEVRYTQRWKEHIVPGLFFFGTILVVWMCVISASVWEYLLPHEDVVHRSIALRNMVLPTALFIGWICVLALSVFLKKRWVAQLVAAFLLLVVMGDLYRFGRKFTPFSPVSWIYPPTSLIQKIQEDRSLFRVMATDRRILPPNVAGMYHLQDVAGYDPLYLRSYNGFAAAWSRNTPDISAASFHRIVTPSSVSHVFTDLVGVKYILSFDSIRKEGYELVAIEGDTKLYRNTHAYPRAFFISSVIHTDSKQDEMNMLYRVQDKLRSIATTTEDIPPISPVISPQEKIRILPQGENGYQIQTHTEEPHLMVMTDPWYPTWQATLDGKPIRIYMVDYMFRGIVIPAGDHVILIRNTWG